MKYWLMKSEPETFSFTDLKKKKKALWDGVRNYQARNFMSQEMSIGDMVLFYHSSCEVPGVAGLAKVSAPAQPDPTQFKRDSEYYDAKATPEKPIWFCVEVAAVEEFKNYVSLSQIREEPKLKDLLLLKRGQRLSIQPVSESHFKILSKMGGV